MIMSRDQDAGRSHSIKTNNRSFEMVEEFKYLKIKNKKKIKTWRIKVLFRQKLRAE